MSKLYTEGGFWDPNKKVDAAFPPAPRETEAPAAGLASPQSLFTLDAGEAEFQIALLKAGLKAGKERSIKAQATIYAQAFNALAFVERWIAQALAAPSPAPAGPTDAELKPFGWAPGNYENTCRDCWQDHVADKRAGYCRPCAAKSWAKAKAAQPGAAAPAAGDPEEFKERLHATVHTMVDDWFKTALPYVKGAGVRKLTDDLADRILRYIAPTDKGGANGA